MKIDIWWDGLAGYAASSWRSLAQSPGVELNVIAIRLPQSSNTSFNDKLISDLPVTLVSASELPKLVTDRTRQPLPDIIFVSGWARKAYRAAVRKLALTQTRLVISIDNPWRSTLKQHLGIYALKSYVSKFDAALVPGERSWQYATRLGFRDRPVFKGLYGVDSSTIENLLSKRGDLKLGWPKSFLFVGRFVPEKDIKTLAIGYQKYRSAVSDPWPLDCVGTGPLKYLLEDIPGVQLPGFVQPAEMPEFWLNSGAFVLPSSYDPWPLALVEAGRAGLPIIHSTACGSAVENVRDNYNGKQFNAGDSQALANAFLFMHKNYSQLPLMGSRSMSLTESYTSESCAKNWYEVSQAVLSLPKRRA